VLGIGRNKPFFQRSMMALGHRAVIVFQELQLA
jgi:hypothetical protein